MRYLSFILSTLSLAHFLCACDPCGRLDCRSDNYEGLFRIVRATDGIDLVFGPNPVYDHNQIKFYSLKGTDTTFYSHQAIRFGGSGYDSILHVRFFPAPETAYMRLGNGDIDTFALSYRTFDTRCCGTITEITKFRLNNRTDIPGSEGTQEIKK